MIFYSAQTAIGCALVCILILLSIYVHFVKEKPRQALAILILTGFVLRVFIALLDPYLQDWDERFHALVAKNMMDNPFKPMLRAESIIPYNIEDWCCNHIWVHKQPLFLWFMALSMKIFGVSVLHLLFFLRFPIINWD